jgi:hypothetical protein
MRYGICGSLETPPCRIFSSLRILHVRTGTTRQFTAGIAAENNAMIMPILLGPTPAARVNVSQKKVKAMEWTSPVFEEVVLCCEINSYVSAQL